MSLAAKLLSASGGLDKLYVDDVFSTYLYTGNGSTQTINNGIDLAGKGGLVWTKSTDHVSDHVVYASGMGNNNLHTNLVDATNFGTPYFSFLSNGYAASSWGATTANFWKYVSWTFRKSPKFFDVVTYTGNGASNRAIAHLLGQEVGMVMTKATSTTGDWNTYHRSATGDLVLNTTATQTGSKALVNSATTSTFTVSGAANTNAVTYVAYLFAHDPSADGIVQCGSFTGNGSSTGPTINLGWEPQYVLIKQTTAASGWEIFDTSRGMSVGSNDAILYTEANSAEASGNYLSPTATGFAITTTDFSTNNAGGTYIYLAIRRPNKPPTTGTQVYNGKTYTGVTSQLQHITGVGFSPDLTVLTYRTAPQRNGFFDKLRGVSRLISSAATDAESFFVTTYLTQFEPDGFYLQNDSSYSFNQPNGASFMSWNFRRAPGVFDVVCYTGMGVAKTEAHGLGVAPELMIVKSRNAGTNWFVYCSYLGATKYLMLNLTTATNTSIALWNNTEPTGSMFTIGTQNGTHTQVAYLFASKLGISKVGSYTGNGTSQTIDCGFTTGARFVMIKRTDAAGDWYVWDTVRGLVAGNDPHLSLNSTTAEITTDDSLDPASVGFIVNQLAATNINVTSASYIYLSFA